MRTAIPQPRGGSVDREYRKTFAIDRTKHYLVQNRTPKRVQIVDDHYGELWLPPLAQRVVAGPRLAPFEHRLTRLRQRHEVRVRVHVPADPPLGLELIGIALAALAGITVLDLARFGTLRRPESFAGMGLFLAACVTVWGHSALRELQRRRRARSAFTGEGDVEYGVGGALYDGNDTARRAKYAAALVVVLLIGVALPAVAIFVATDAKDFLVLDGGLHVKEGMESRLVARLIQVVYTVVLTLFPALMYFQFDRQRVGTLRGMWVREIFRMDHQMQTMADVDARYGDQVAEASSWSTDSVRFLDGRHSPIMVATILIALGWTLLVVRTESFDFAGANEIVAMAESADQASDRAEEAAAATGTDLEARAAAADAAADEAARASQGAVAIAAESTGDTVPPTPTTDASPSPASQDALDETAAAAQTAAERAAAAEATVQQPYFQLLVPTPSAATMAFLGAYFFAVYLVLRGYFRGDLRPKLYNQITARLVTVVVLAYLLTVLYSGGGDTNRFLWTTAFLAGVVPTTVLQRVGMVTTSVVAPIAGRSRYLRERFAGVFATPRSLTLIDGIDIYDSARLESEGITDIPSLAKSDLVSMMISTRLPVERLIDWTDQAVLALLVEEGADDGAGGGAGTGASDGGGGGAVRGGDHDGDVASAGGGTGGPVALGDGGDGSTSHAQVRQLRRLGIRTASDLLAVARDDGPVTRRPAVEAVLGGGAMGKALLQGLAAQIAEEPSVRRIVQWRASEMAELECACPVIRDGSDSGAPATRAGAGEHRRSESAAAGAGPNGRRT